MLHQFTRRRVLLLLAALALVLSASGFVLEHGFGVIPCKMCWWQRYVHWAIFGLAALGLIRPHLARTMLSLVIMVAIVGLGIAAWQFAAQHGWLPFPPTCGADDSQTFAAGEDLLAALNQTKIVPCDKENFKLLGLSLAGWNIPSMLLAMVLASLGLKKHRA